MWAVVPSKQFGSAKQRLTALLSVAERVVLAEVMLRDVLAALSASDNVSGVVVVSKEPAAANLATEFQAKYLPEAGNDLSLAVTQGGAFVADMGEESMLMVPGDVPLLCVDEIDQMIATHGGQRGLTLVSDRDGTGTNGLVVSPLNLITFAYGTNSFKLHAAAAHEIGASVRTLALDGLSLDIDTPEDVRILMGYEQPSATLDYLDEIDVVSRLAPRHNVGRAVFG